MLRDIEGNNIETFEERNERVAKHTRGPWRVMQGSINFPPLLVRSSQTDKAIADCDYQDGEEGAANARLIAAAPEMSQVLLEELDAIRTWLGAETNADITDGMFISIDKIKRVLFAAGVRDE